MGRRILVAAVGLAASFAANTAHAETGYIMISPFAMGEQDNNGSNEYFSFTTQNQALTNLADYSCYVANVPLPVGSKPSELTTYTYSDSGRDPAAVFLNERDLETRKFKMIVDGDAKGSGNVTSNFKIKGSTASNTKTYGLTICLDSNGVFEGARVTYKN